MGIMSSQKAFAAPPQDVVGTRASEEFYVFAEFTLYPQRRRLLRDEIPIEIGGRAFDVLLLLVSRAGSVISAAEFMNFVWPNVVVEEANLRVQIGIVRRLLSKFQEATSAIETVALRGYCFVLPVRHFPGEAEIPNPPAVRSDIIPALHSPLFGREDAVDLIVNALADRRLVTITGPGGIGKSVVAIATAYRCVEQLKGKIVFVDLSLASDGAEASRAILEVLQIAPQGDPVSDLRDHLRDREVLLVLDTCEHIVESIAALAEALLGDCPKVRLLVTSREALRAAGEWTHRLSSLTFPQEGEPIEEGDVVRFSAVEMLIDRIQSSMRFAICSQDLPMLAEICRRLDGIPLALEFAAARVPELGLCTIASNLDDRFSILTRGRRTALPRHRTLSAALDWSYNLLSSDEQGLLRLLATLGRSFTAEHAIAAGDAAGCKGAQESLASLYDKSFISVEIRDGQPNYRLLDTTSAYVSRVGAT